MRGPSATTKPSYPPPGDDGDPMRPVAAAAAAAVGLRKKGTGVRAWLLLDAAGQTQVVKAGKHAIMRRTGLPARDLRILDPLLSYPSTVLGRERAIVINLEHIKAIITAQEVFLLNSHDPSVAPFVEGLRRRILRHHHDTKTQEGRANGDDSEWENLSDLEDPQSRSISPKIFSSASPQFLARDEESKVESKQGHDEESKVESKQSHDEESKVESKEDHDESRDSLKVLPFEFVALEACLEAACSCLDSEARTLEQEAHPALDKLTSKISTLNLERVRQIKSRLVAITGRVQKVRDELEHLLDDDEDMAEMYLTDKLLQQQLGSSASSIDERDGMDDGVTQSEIEERLGAEISGEAIGDSTRYDGGIPPESLFNGRAISRASRGTRTSTTRSTINKHVDVEELEMLLEAYFVQIDGTLNKLSTLREYVDDTEDYINIMLDDKQNHLLQMGVTLTTATLVVSAFVVVAGIFGMNITIDMFKDEGSNTGMRKWLWTVGGGTSGTIFLYVVAIAWCKKRRLLE